MLCSRITRPKLFSSAKFLKSCAPNSVGLRYSFRSSSIMANVTDGKTLFEDINKLVAHANLALGSPGPRELEACREMLVTATTWRMGQPDAASLFQYGPRSGFPGFREKLAEFLTKHYGEVVSSDRLMTTAGATSGFSMLASYYFSAGDTVFVEDTTYFLAINYCKEDCGFNVVCVPCDEHGFIPSELERLIAEHRSNFKQTNEAKPFKAMIYTIPTYHNPSGRCMPADRCNDVVRIAKNNDLLVVCDDVYNLLPYSPKLRDGDFNFESKEDSSLKSPPRMVHYDYLANSSSPSYGNVVSIGTFSKILAPGARIGWLEGSDHVLGPLRGSAFVQSGGSVQQLMAGLIEAMLQLGLQDKHLAECRVQYEKRAKALCRSFKEHLPAEVQWKPPAGGYFIWLQLPDNVDGEELKNAAAKEGISMSPGVSSSPEGKFRNYIRVCFTYEDEDVLERVGKPIGRLIRTLM